MKILIAIFILVICTFNPMFAQQASDYLPPLHSMWEIETVSMIQDSILSVSERYDSLASITQIDNYQVYSISTSDDTTYYLETRDDTLFIKVTQIVDIFDDGLLGFDIDPVDRLPLAIFSADVNDEWDGYIYRDTIEMSQSLRELIPSNINVDNDIEIQLSIRGVRLPAEIITLPLGEITAEVFETKMDLTATIYVLLFGARIPLSFDLVENFLMDSYIGFGRGIVMQNNEEYKVIAHYESTLFNINEELATLPAIQTEMKQFNPGDPTSITENLYEIPHKVSLYQNYPNPFNPKTLIRFSITERNHITLNVYDILGRLISQLVNEELHPGVYTVKFDADNLPSGMYIYTLDAGTYTEQKRMVLVK